MKTEVIRWRIVVRYPQSICLGTRISYKVKSKNIHRAYLMLMSEV